jgi:hypothetical protein
VLARWSAAWWVVSEPLVVYCGESFDEADTVIAPIHPAGPGKVRSLFADDPGPQRCEELRVLSREEDYMVVQLVRTESLRRPRKWKLLTKRMPECWVAGFVGRMYFTPWELEYLQGRKELP